jgi:ubiquinol-cytochrome c reductase iron-sulfur subunit
MSSIAATPSSHADNADPSRRDFLTLTTLAGAAIGAGAFIWPFIDSMQPAADTLAAGEPIDVDISKIAAGQQIIIVWRGKPVFLVRRDEAALKTLQDPALIADLKDPDSRVAQQPAYALNWHRSLTPDLVVLVGVCTHLGCVPTYFPNPSESTPAVNWPGGYFCFCHGSKYDLAGRVRKGVPAPYNLPVPPYRMAGGTILRIGENTDGGAFDLNSVVQI